MNERLYRYEEEDYDAVWSWNEEKAVRVEIAVNNWIIDNEIFCSETLVQCDRGLIESPELVGKILEILQIKVTSKDVED